MQFKAPLLLALCFAGRLAASGGSPESWLDGTQPWDTTPIKEMDLEAYADGADGRPDLGAGAKVGVFDMLQVGAAWRGALAGGPSLVEFRTQLREDHYPTWRPAFALFGRLPWDGQAWQARGGLIAAVEPWDCSLVGNVEGGGEAGLGVRLGFWTPYLVSMLRLGVEGSWLAGFTQAVTPQILLNGPGDVSLGLGVRLDTTGGSQPSRVMARLSYQLFPSP